MRPIAGPGSTPSGQQVAPEHQARRRLVLDAKRGAPAPGTSPIAEQSNSPVRPVPVRLGQQRQQFEVHLLGQAAERAVAHLIADLCHIPA